MDQLQFTIGDRPYNFSVKGSPEFAYGKPELLSNASTDITHALPWYELGYHAAPFADAAGFKALREGLSASIRSLVEETLGISVPDFELERYHEVVTNFEDHFKVVSRTRDLFPGDFNFPITELLPTFGELVGFPLTDLNPHSGKRMHIIVRINRPGSTDFNPPHKDIYESVDIRGFIPRFINLWIPIAGVTQRSTLPIAAGSHLIPEDQVLRTFAGSVVEGNTYGVRCVREWGGSTALERPVVEYGEVLLFSSHLVHGLAVNEENTTRVALEFRLFKDE